VIKIDKRNFTKPNGKLVSISIGRDRSYAFIPKPLPPQIEYDKDLAFLLSEADRSFSRLAGLGQNLDNPYLLILPYIKKEAVASSKIEGTQASLTDLFLYELQEKKPKEDPLRIKEVNNYVIATQRALKSLRKNEISADFIRYMHSMLLRRVRGQKKHPGHFRLTQNAIVPYENCPIEKIIFIPPPSKEVMPLITDLERFMKGEQRIPLLIRAAMIHYQFETIHPFEDGNGRIGRLLITLYLCKKGDMKNALLYISGFLTKNRDEYYGSLLKVSQKNDWEDWIKYFLTAINTQSLEVIKDVEKLINLKKIYDTYLRRAKVSKNVKMLSEQLFTNPYTTVNNAARYLGISYQAAIKIIKTLIRLGILVERGKKKRNKVYMAVDIMRILDRI
jgi:Fic family protein